MENGMEWLFWLFIVWLFVVSPNWRRFQLRIAGQCGKETVIQQMLLAASRDSRKSQLGDRLYSTQSMEPHFLRTGFKNAQGTVIAG